MRQTNTRKKNNLRSMIIVALLLLLVAVIGFGGYTLSKYVSNKTEGGTAQVAKWGYTVEADATNLFGKNYKFATDSSVVTNETANLTVSSSSTAKLVAPGTSGYMTFSIKGTAEVLAEVDIEFTATSDIKLNYTKGGVAGTPYMPVKWTLKKGTTTLVDGKTLADVAAELNKNSYDVIYDANVTAINDEYTLSWSWAFENTENTDSNDLDTLLGMIANNGTVTTNGEFVKTEGTSTTISFELKMSVVQLAKKA